MKKKISPKLRKALKKAALLGIEVDSVLDGSLQGSYTEKPLNLIEFTLHEAAHILTLGQSLNHLDQLGKPAADWIASKFNDIPRMSSNALEMDTSFITYLAGVELKLWDDDTQIKLSCGKNLRHQTTALYAQVDELFKSEPGHSYQRLVRQLVCWWRKP